jgi:hypothetical protein
VLDQFDTTPPERIAMANRQIRKQSVASISRRLAEARTRQQLSVIDELIALLEERNLDGERRIDQVVRKWLRRLETEIGTPVPRRVLRARNTVRLHGALLDWMETALDELIRARRGRSGDADLD